ncbi:MAG: DUF4406 domain-containing protein [Acidobacteria bacterium]|nr:DUF4406 domain-containing protein [Acidobacteriota bacterium]
MNKAASQTIEGATRQRSWREEADMLLSLIDCLVLNHEAVYASSEFTTGKRVYDLCRQYDVRSREELKSRLGTAYEARVLSPNKEEGIRFARKLREYGHQVVLTPHPFHAAPHRTHDWTQPEYLGFWEEVIAKKCRAVYFNDAWEFSNGCVFEFCVALKQGLPLFDSQNKPLDAATGKGLISAAIQSLEAEKFPTAKLREALRELGAF